jgi:hypothetical protein
LRFDGFAEEGYLFCRSMARAPFNWLPVSTVSLHPSLGNGRLVGNRSSRRKSCPSGLSDH